MGCDGGTIPKRDELVRTKKKGEQKDRHSERAYRWRNCAVSQTPLQAPIVACELGRLYNKEEVIKKLINKSQNDSNNMSHIRGLKDIKLIKLSSNPAYDEKEHLRGGQSGEQLLSPWICPVAGTEMNGQHGFCFSWYCGCVLSSRAMKEVSGNICNVCGGPLNRSDVITINPPTELLEEATARMTERRKKAKEAKKEAKESKKRTDDTEQSIDKPAKKQKTINNGASSSSGASSSKKFTSISGLASSILRGTEFTSVRSKDFSVAKNPQHSEVYKSIFDTHKSANKKLKSNWVTCNPQYY